MNFPRFALLCVFLACSSATDARVVPFVTYQELFDKADLVLVALPKGTSDTKERINLPGIQIGDSATGQAARLPAIGVETEFRVLGVMKGDKSLKKIVLHHYRLAEGDADEVGVGLAAFDPKKHNSYLLFLKREQDGRYAPFDQTDPTLQSVQKLESNLIFPPDKD